MASIQLTSSSALQFVNELWGHEVLSFLDFALIDFVHHSIPSVTPSTPGRSPGNPKGKYDTKPSSEAERKVRHEPSAVRR